MMSSKLAHVLIPLSLPHGSTAAGHLRSGVIDGLETIHHRDIWISHEDLLQLLFQKTPLQRVEKRTQKDILVVLKQVNSPFLGSLGIHGDSNEEAPKFARMLEAAAKKIISRKKSGQANVTKKTKRDNLQNMLNLRAKRKE
ncbi:hypothetical protein ElyMa_003560200 [Elysia marginata]|uniref:Uncharacterized protein n=1 Tax=Elysia marginata TaxID=1093978 RepID=A0AAV4ELS3_9GAST|nr:hypothetical protein ElyMa_003560200 [Elysia marginata]